MTTQTSKEILTSVLAELGSIRCENAPLGTTIHRSRLLTLSPEAQERAKASLLTLHFLFPHELLPALDILDRRLVNGFRYVENPPDSPPVVYYVQSASAVTESNSGRTANSRFRNAWIPSKAHYEVRLDSWNCSCPAFAQSQLKMLRKTPITGSSDAEGSNAAHVLFGGSVTKDNTFVPVCKHILATAVYASASDLFGYGCRYETVSAGHLASWSAGYGDI